MDPAMNEREDREREERRLSFEGHEKLIANKGKKKTLCAQGGPMIKPT